MSTKTKNLFLIILIENDLVIFLNHETRGTGSLPI